MSKFGGVGIVNAVVLALFTMVIIVGMKAILTNYHIDGLSEVVQAV